MGAVEDLFIKLVKIFINDKYILYTFYNMNERHDLFSPLLENSIYKYPFIRITIVFYNLSHLSYKDNDDYVWH